MPADYELALEVVDRIRQIWQAEPSCLRWMGDISPKAMNAEGYGFDWWPGQYCVSLRVNGPHPNDRNSDDPMFRVSLRTPLVLNADISAPGFYERLVEANTLMPSFALLTAPTDMVARIGGDPRRRPLWLGSTGYMNWHNGANSADMFARLGMLQPTEAEARGEEHAELLGGRPAIDTASSPSAGASRQEDVFDLEDKLAHSAGEPDFALAEAEFPELAALWNQTPNITARVDDARLSLEFEFSDDAGAYIVLRRDLDHNSLGFGLVGILTLPATFPAHAAAEQANTLNFSESSRWNMHWPAFLGHWTTVDAGDDLFQLRYISFVPRTYDGPDVAGPMLLDMIGRIFWLNDTF